ncbi:MAG: hypothetical protein ACLU38_04725 [Dysosmobacter sp.]
MRFPWMAAVNCMSTSGTADEWGIQTEQERFSPEAGGGTAGAVLLHVLASTGELICIKRGESGYYPSDWSTDDSAQNREIADYNNERLGVTPAQRGSHENGFHVRLGRPRRGPRLAMNRPSRRWEG